jgi:hypothetical protein
LRVDRIGWALTGVILVATFALFVVWRLSFLSSMPRPLAEFYIELTPEHAIDLAPDGSALAYASRHGDDRLLHLRRLDGGGLTRLAGTEDAASPTFSPDGRQIVYAASGRLKRIALDTGAVSDLAEVGDRVAVSFLEDGTMLVGSAAGLFRWGTKGILDPVRPLPVRSLAVVPGSRWIVAEVGDGGAGESRLEALSFSGGERRELVPSGSLPRYVGNGTGGHLLFLKDSVLFASRFDPRSAELARSPVAVVRDADWYDVAADGTLAYRRRTGPRPAIVVVLHWTSELTRLAP